jgi:hypothetical protein
MRSHAVIGGLIVLAAGVLADSAAAAEAITAVRASDFLNSIGVCTHIGQGIDRAPQCATALAYAGVRNIRDDGNARHVPDWISVHKEAGVRVVLTWSGPGDAAISSLISSSRQLAAAGALLALEGPNEPNNWAVTYQGQKSQSKSTFMPVANWQRAFYSKVKSDPVLKDYPVFHSSEAGGSEPDNVGLQFLTIPKGAGTLMPDGTQYADYANVHNYICRRPKIIDNMAWLNADPLFHDWTDGIYVEYGKTWRKGFPGYSNADLVTLPRVTTETGWATGGKGLTQDQQGRLYLNIYLAQFKQGFKYSFIYMLRDGGGGDAGYGIFDTNYRPKTSATYLHNLTTILADKSSSFAPEKVNYSITGKPATVHDLLLQKSNGTLELAVWGEQVKGTNSVTVNLGSIYRTVSVYDPTVGTTAIQTFSNVASVPLTLSDHPLIVELQSDRAAPGALPSPPATTAPAAKPITVPLRALSSNPNYFTDGSGKAIYLTGSHTWNNLQDWGTNGSIQPLDFPAYVKMLVAHNHNFTLLWATELPTFRGLPTTASSPPDFSVTPHPWQRTGPGNASDGKLKFDLTQFNQTYFDRLRDRVQQLDAAGIYAGVYLFSGEWLLRFRFSGDGYPLTGSNNVNGIDDGGGTRAVTMTAPNAITAIQDAYVKKVIDTLNDLPNVLWIVSQEAPPESTWWNSHLIALTRIYEAGKPLQHPIGYGVLADMKDATIMNSDADWIAPAARISPTISRGSGHPPRKVTINDSDHSYFGIWNDSPQAGRDFFWSNFTNGNQTLFMDPYVVYYPRERRNLCPSPVNGIGSGPDRRWENVRNTMGYIRGYADRVNLATMTAQGKLSSTGHALVSANATNPEVLVYAPSSGQFTVNLSGSGSRFAVEWMNPATGVRSPGEDVSGGTTRTFFPPFNGDAVLYLRASAPAAAR